jgi:hypothetical protein
LPVASLRFFKWGVSQCKMLSPDLPELAAVRRKNWYAFCSSASCSLMEPHATVQLFHSGKKVSVHGYL